MTALRPRFSTIPSIGLSAYVVPSSVVYPVASLPVTGIAESATSGSMV